MHENIWFPRKVTKAWSSILRQVSWLHELPDKKSCSPEGSVKNTIAYSNLDKKKNVRSKPDDISKEISRQSTEVAACLLAAYRKEQEERKKLTKELSNIKESEFTE